MGSTLWNQNLDPESHPILKEIEVILYLVNFGSTQRNHLSEEPKERRGICGSAPFCNFLLISSLCCPTTLCIEIDVLTVDILITNMIDGCAVEC